MNRAELLAKIKKCLALSKSANEHEASAALAKARQLMDEYGLDQSDVDMVDVEEAPVKGGGAVHPARWEQLLVLTITRAIPCHPIGIEEDGWRFIGLTPAPEIASYAFVSLFRKLRAARKDYMATKLKRVQSAHRKTQRADAFAEAWAEAVFVKVAQLYPKQETDALVRQYLAKHYTDLVPAKKRSSTIGKGGDNDRYNGWKQGRDVELNHGVEAASAPLQLA